MGLTATITAHHTTAVHTTNEPPTASHPEPTGPTAPLPPLRVHHLLAWTAVTAVVLGLNFSYRSAVSQIADWWWVASLPGLMGSTLGFTIGGFGLYWRRRGLPFPSQPGHGLLIFWLIESCFALLWQFPIALFVAAVGGFDENNIPAWVETLWQVQHYTSLILFLTIYIGLAWWIRPLRRWQVFFLLCALHFSASYVERLYWFTLFGPIENLEFVGPLLAMAIAYVLAHATLLFPGVALLVAVIWDHRDRLPRHWSHWAGIIAWCSMIPSEIVRALINTGWLPSPVLMD